MNYSYINQPNNAPTSGIGQNQMPFMSPSSQPLQYQSIFPQPIGSAYNLNTSNEIGNIPAGAGVSIGLCLNENILYIKGLQNGSPILLGYNLIPIEGVPNPVSIQSPRQGGQALEEENRRLKDSLGLYDEKIRMLESQIGKIKEKLGGRNEWEI